MQLPKGTTKGKEDRENPRDVGHLEEPDSPIAMVDQTESRKSRFSSFFVRLLSTAAMVSGFTVIIYMGHVPLVALIFLIQWRMVRELFELARKAQQEKNLPGFRAQQWYFFGVATFFVYLRFVKNNLLVEITSNATMTRLFGWLLKRHSIVSYSLYTAGLIFFVLSLKKGMYLYQFGQYAWTHMILMVVFVPSSFFVSNIFEGIIWFLLPVSLIIVNDICAYMAGILFGRTPLINLSPKKTWEGFIGAFIGTVGLSFVLAGWLSEYDWMICPRTDFSVGWLTCRKDEMYIEQEYKMRDIGVLLPPSFVEFLGFVSHQLPDLLTDSLQDVTVSVKPIMLHAAVLAVFASVIAPFGGFFASGFKRAFRVKDFAAMIPGHGGMTDRMDCQMMMAVFSYLYYYNFVYEAEVDVGSVLSMAVKLDNQQQVELFIKLGNYLLGERLIPDSERNCLHQLVGQLR